MGALHIYAFDIYRAEHALSQKTYAATKDNLLVDTDHYFLNG